VIHGGYALGMWKFWKVNSGFLPDVRHGLVHFQGFRNRLASFWTEAVAVKAATWHQSEHKLN
jgi:hypothetical protein